MGKQVPESKKEKKKRKQVPDPVRKEFHPAKVVGEMEKQVPNPTKKEFH
jgi:hypothetical protein